jgi:CheY-like chemotaxis protein
MTLLMNPSHKLKDAVVLIVEDEALVAMNLESMLEDLGCRIAGPAMRLERAHALIEAGPLPQAAILDVNIAGSSVFPVAKRLQELGVPFIFATGYGHAGIPPEFPGHPVLQKPYSMDDIERSLIEVLGI